MASLRPTRFPGAMFDQNYPRSNFNMNPSGDNQYWPPFQRSPNTKFTTFPPPQRFMQGNFQNRPPFSNFPDIGGVNAFINRQPPPNQVFHPRIPPPNQMFQMNRPPPSPSPEIFLMNRPPAPPETFRMNVPAPDQPFRMNVPPPRPRFSSSPFERPYRPWNQMPSFHNIPRNPFQSRPQLAQTSSYHQKDSPLQANRKRKPKLRDFRKLKEDTTEKPFSCDTCDRAFVTEEQLNEHLSLHLKCDIGNCTFEAHPKIVALHKRMQHDTGYADTINKLNNAAEIQKWREERKRHYPTAENIKKRQAEQAEREARGEVLETKEFGKFKRRREENGNITNTERSVRGRFKRNDRKRKFQHYQFSQSTTVNLDSDSDSDCDSHIKLKQFLGLSSLANSAVEKCDRNEDIEKISSPHTANENHSIPSENSNEQNLPKSDSDNLSLADNNSSNEKHDDTSFVLNLENGNADMKLAADESVCEIPESEIESVKKTHEVIVIEDVTLPIDESVCEIPESEIESVKKTHEVVNLENSDDEGPISIPIQKSSANDDDADNEGPEIVPVSKSLENSITEESQISEKMEQKSLATGISCEVSETFDENKRDKNGERQRKRKRNEQYNENGFNRQNPAFQVRKSTLLEKLLADDIRHERNIALQCIRHIVNNDFFGLDNKKPRLATQ